MYFRGEYEPDTTRLFATLSEPAWTVLDVGANVGYFSVVAAQCGGPGTTVVAFEPNPRVYEMLKQTSSLNGESIIAENLACGYEPGELPLYLTPQDRNSGLSTLVPEVCPVAGVVKVSVVTLDDYCSANKIRPTVAKIDVEGFELEVLRGAEDLITRGCMRAVIAEVCPDRVDPQPMLRWLGERGYKMNRITPNGTLEFVDTYENGEGFYFENLCFTR
jgi:FkbM family methyltransferase